MPWLCPNIPREFNTFGTSIACLARRTLPQAIEHPILTFSGSPPSTFMAFCILFKFIAFYHAVGDLREHSPSVVCVGRDFGEWHASLCRMVMPFCDNLAVQPKGKRDYIMTAFDIRFPALYICVYQIPRPPDTLAYDVAEKMVSDWLPPLHVPCTHSLPRRS